MKVSRRTFLSIGSFIVGGAAGTALSPLPWKLTDDLSIWTQNWPWTPMPERGEVSYVNSVCTLCPGGCGISVRKVNDRAVKIEGMKGHPVNDGGICILGLSGLQLLYGPTRIKTPLKRVGEKGQGKFKKISWDEALKEVAEKLGTLRSEGKSHTVACVSGSACGTVPQLLKRLLTVYGSPNFMSVPTMQDAYAVTLKLMHGVDACPGFDVENADFILSFGSGIIEGWGSTVRMFKANSAWQDKKIKVVQIESRMSNTAAKAAKWIPARPGSEGVLALGIAYMMLRDGLYKKEVCDSAAGFEDFRKTVSENYAPENIAAATGIEKETIESLAKEFAGAASPLAICGRGQGHTPGSQYEFMAVHALNALAGNINKAGGVFTVPDPKYIAWAEPELDETAQKGMSSPRIDGAGSETYPHAKSLLNRLPPAILSAQGECPVQALLISEANPCYTLSDTQTVKKAFAKIPFVVSFSSYMDETAQYADIILPNHAYLERLEDAPAYAAGLSKPVIGLSKPVVTPQFDTKHTGDAVIALAKALGDKVAAAFPWESYAACLEETLGDKWKSLNEKCFAVVEESIEAPLQFFKQECKPVFAEGDEKQYPFVLMPYDSIRLANGFIGNTPFLTKTVPDTVLRKNDIFVEINPKSAGGDSLSLREGSAVMLTTPKGSAKVRVHLSEEIMPGVIAIPRGLGHTAYDKYLAGKGINCNELIGPAEDSGSGFDAVWGIRAKLSSVSI